MKNFKRIAGILLALVIAMSMVSAAFAEGTTGSITINNIGGSATYDVYRMLDLESYDKTAGAYSYKVNSDWTGFLTGEGAGTAYLTVAADGYVTWTAAEDDDTKATFAKLALAYAEANGIAPTQSSANDGEFVITGTSGKFSNLPLGYYLIDSTMGALCGLTTTNPDASINAKNAEPTIDKQVKEDSTDQWGASNTADIGQIVDFRVTINVHAGAQNFVFHDEMSEGLTFKGVTSIDHVVPGSGTHAVTEDQYDIKDATDEGTENDPTDDCTFEIVFSKEFCDHLETNDKIIINYRAMLNRHAIVAGDGNPNTAWLTYGENHNTTPDYTSTYTFSIDIIKTDSQNTLIDGAKFKIYDAETGGNEVAVVELRKSDIDDSVTSGSENDVLIGYRRARSDEKGVEIVVAGGKVEVIGFDNGTYYLEETAAPSGFNKLTARQKFIISDANLEATFNGDIYSTGSGVHVVNKTGSMLPETGGIGTTLFYVIGGVLVAAAVVLLVTRKRMNEK